MKNYNIVDGNKVCAYTSYHFSELAGIYPITPASPMAEEVDKIAQKNEKNFYNDTVKVVEMQSEAGAIGLVHGALQAGVLATTYTASQGLLLMIPNMYKIAGELLPCVINVAARSLATHALSILCDHQDIYAVRQTGFAILYSSSVEQVGAITSVSYLSALKGKVPFVNAFDGFRTSHELQKISYPNMDKIKELIDKKALNDFRKKALTTNKSITRGTTQMEDIYFQNMEARNVYYDELPDIVNDYMEKINEIEGTNYKPFNYYGSKTAKRVIVAMGSVCETIKETIDYLNEDIGLIEVHLYRPFSSKYLIDVLPKTTEKIAVLDRTKEAGSSGEPLYLDVVNVLKDKNIEIIGGRYGISSKDVAPKHIKAVYDFLSNKHFNNFTVGIIDDITHRSIDVDDNFTIKKDELEMLIYGYGSDGMVSASKNIMKIVGDKTDKYVQGYFQYDSKKSGGITRSHLRISDNKIRSTYYVNNASIVVCTKASYLSQFDMISNIKDNGVFILNSNLSDEECLKLINKETIQKLVDKNIKFYIADAISLSINNNLGNKISMIMETILLHFLDVVDEEEYKNTIKDFVKEKFGKKGKEVVESNIKVIDDAMKCVREVKVKEISEKQEDKKCVDKIIDSINKLEANNLPVSAFINHEDGTYEGGNTVYEKRKISEFVPVWIKENCIQCNECSFVCPHAVIRPFLLDEEENKKVSDSSIKALGPDLKDYNFMIGVSYDDCTGCMHCVKTCPGMKGNKALTMASIHDIKTKSIDDYLFSEVKPKNIEKKNNVKYSQFQKPRFEFPGSCSGCGETPYLKILTQLFGENLIISNATGCSSIYGASLPSTPYSIPWINSLFEDNAEVGYGIYTANKVIRDRLKSEMKKELNSLDEDNKRIYQEFIDNFDDINKTNELLPNIKLSDNLKEYKDYLRKPSVWCIGGDGWAYDIGYAGIDHVLSSNENINILVLDTEVYSNTGGQASKSSRVGSVSLFASSGKKTKKKDLAKIAMTHDNVFVAQICLGYNKQSVVDAFKSAEEHNGPSIIIAYAPCISHGIKGGMSNSIDNEKLACECGYLPVFKYIPEEDKLTLYNKEVDFDKYEEFLETQTRYNMLKTVNEESAKNLLEDNKQAAIKRYNDYKSIMEKGLHM